MTLAIVLGSKSLKPVAFEEIYFPPVANEESVGRILNTYQLLDTNHFLNTSKLYNTKQLFLWLKSQQNNASKYTG